MSVYKDLGEALEETRESLTIIPILATGIVVKTENEYPYCPVLIMPPLKGLPNPIPGVIESVEKKGDAKVVAVFATIR